MYRDQTGDAAGTRPFQVVSPVRGHPAFSGARMQGARTVHNAYVTKPLHLAESTEPPLKISTVTHGCKLLVTDDTFSLKKCLL